MLTVVRREGTPPSPLWIDVVDPSRGELDDLGTHYHLQKTQLDDCLQPGHLPKHEKAGATTFMIVRVYDEHADARADEVLSMTRKLALFLGDRFLISVHWRDVEPLAPLREHYEGVEGPVYLQQLMLEILLGAVESYYRPLEEIELRIHWYEASVLSQQKGGGVSWSDVFHTKCRLMTIKRILWHTLNATQKFVPNSAANLPLVQDLKERIESLHFFADGLLEDLTSLLNIQMSLAASESMAAANDMNAVMKILALMSAFFLPINFIVGFYGMNFEHMPELKWRYGYPVVWCVILATGSGIWLWFKRRGWLR